LDSALLKRKASKRHNAWVVGRVLARENVKQFKKGFMWGQVPRSMDNRGSHGETSGEERTFATKKLYTEEGESQLELKGRSRL